MLLLHQQGATLEPTPVPGGVIPPHDGSGPHHLGFAGDAGNYEDRRKHLTAQGITIESEP